MCNSFWLMILLLLAFFLFRTGCVLTERCRFICSLRFETCTKITSSLSPATASCRRFCFPLWRSSQVTVCFQTYYLFCRFSMRQKHPGRAAPRWCLIEVEVSNFSEGLGNVSEVNSLIHACRDLAPGNFSMQMSGSTPPPETMRSSTQAARGWQDTYGLTSPAPPDQLHLSTF